MSNFVTGSRTFPVETDVLKSTCYSVYYDGFRCKQDNVE